MFSHWFLLRVFTVALFLGGSLAWANDTLEIEEHIRNKQWTQAQQKLQSAIKQSTAKPGSAVSPQLRLMNSQILAGLGQSDKAIEELQALIQEFPELPEPYNNLGVLHAAQGNYHAATTAFLLAIQARPNYKIAHQNLGDLYTAMAQQAYAKAKAVQAGPALLPLPAPAASTTTTTNIRAVR
jgi:tetratricopeptide (TPR) repeat protein